MDGQELLTSLFGELSKLAKRLDCSGIALPEYLGPSFNFDNEETIEKMSIYQKAQSIKVGPLHAESWVTFTLEYGPDRYNSIEDGRFKLLQL